MFYRRFKDEREEQSGKRGIEGRLSWRIDEISFN
jgi:hypothetical protein